MECGHSPSVKSLGYRKLSRLCSTRAIPVHPIASSIFSTKTAESQDAGIAQQLLDQALNVVDMMAAGLAFTATPDICICTRSWWTPMDQAKQALTVVHEVGHKVHMVAKGIGSELGRVATQYDNAGHVGSHCHNGAPAGQIDYDTAANNAASTCVMFGATNGHPNFCSNCGPAVLKVDIGDGY